MSAGSLFFRNTGALCAMWNRSDDNKKAKGYYERICCHFGTVFFVVKRVGKTCRSNGSSCVVSVADDSAGRELWNRLEKGNAVMISDNCISVL